MTYVFLILLGLSPFLVGMLADVIGDRFNLPLDPILCGVLTVYVLWFGLYIYKGVYG